MRNDHPEAWLLVADHGTVECIAYWSEDQALKEAKRKNGPIVSGRGKWRPVRYEATPRQGKARKEP